MGVMLRRQVVLLGAVMAALATWNTPIRAQAAPVPTMAQWEAAERIPLWPGEPPGGGALKQADKPVSVASFITNVAMPELRVFRPEKPNGRSLLSIPGGAYRFVSIANEGVDLANVMTANGYTVFVLVYRLPGEGWLHREDVPLQDAQRAMRVIRSLAGEYRLNADQVYVAGFSAGGHLGATLMTSFDEDVYNRVDAADRQSARPKGIALIYPVISHAAGIGHGESSLLLLGENPSPELIAKRSPALHVTVETPPVFLMHAMDDGAVPVENSIIIIKALRAANRPVEVHLFEEGGHGFGLGPSDLPVGKWAELFANWIDRQEARAE